MSRNQKMKQIAIRVPNKLLLDAARMADKVAESDEGILFGTVTLSDVLRLAIKIGLENLNQRFHGGK